MKSNENFALVEPISFPRLNEKESTHTAFCQVLNKVPWQRVCWSFRQKSDLDSDLNFEDFSEQKMKNIYHFESVSMVTPIQEQAEQITWVSRTVYQVLGN